MGTVNLLEAVRTISSVKAIVNITTDKCYINQEWLWPYRENDALGGNDPYSSSKACTELITHAYRHSFLAKREVHIASARAGNVIGGGDWAMDRLIPDFLRAVDNNSPIIIRSPQAIRPWQHVLEPLSGYLMLAERLFIDGASFSEAWNFGPEQTDMQTVQWIIERLCSYFPKAQWYCQPNFTLSEAQILQLDSSKAKSKLGWFPHWTLSEALSYTLEWYHAWKHGMNMQQISLEQIKAYEMSS
jgi:CDP-glucose 4,6-dehydratase